MILMEATNASQNLKALYEKRPVSSLHFKDYVQGHPTDH